MGNLHEVFAYSVCYGVNRIQPKVVEKNKLTGPPDTKGVSVCSKIRQEKQTS